MMETVLGVSYLVCRPIRRDFQVIHAFSSRLGGVSQEPYASLNLGFGSGDDRACVRDNRCRFSRAVGFAPDVLVTLQQVHSDRVLLVTAEDDVEAVRGAPADALISDRPRLPLGIITADCFPVILVAPQRPALGIVHSGRHGTAHGVVLAAIQLLYKRFGANPTDVFAAIGPGIGGCCYEIDEANAVPFRMQYTTTDGVYRPSRQHHWYVNLQRAIAIQLQVSGVPSSHVWSADLCTACHPRWFYSYRRDGVHSGRMLTVAMLHGERP